MDRLIQLSHEAWALSNSVLTLYVRCEDAQVERLRKIYRRTLARYLRRSYAVHTLAEMEVREA
jgi:hypothetical protein